MTGRVDFFKRPEPWDRIPLYAVLPQAQLAANETHNPGDSKLAGRKAAASYRTPKPGFDGVS